MAIYGVDHLLPGESSRTADGSLEATVSGNGGTSTFAAALPNGPTACRRCTAWGKLRVMKEKNSIILSCHCHDMDSGLFKLFGLTGPVVLWLNPQERGPDARKEADPNGPAGLREKSFTGATTLVSSSSSTRARRPRWRSRPRTAARGRPSRRRSRERSWSARSGYGGRAPGWSGTQ